MRCPWCDGLTSHKDSDGFCTECGRTFNLSAAEKKKNNEAIRLYFAAERLRSIVRELNFYSFSQQDEERKEELEHDIKKHIKIH